jgi:hypothetical protein
LARTNNVGPVLAKMTVVTAAIKAMAAQTDQILKDVDMYSQS